MPSGWIDSNGTVTVPLPSNVLVFDAVVSPHDPAVTIDTYVLDVSQSDRAPTLI